MTSFGYLLWYIAGRQQQPVPHSERSVECKAIGQTVRWGQWHNLPPEIPALKSYKAAALQCEQITILSTEVVTHTHHHMDSSVPITNVHRWLNLDFAQLIFYRYWCAVPFRPTTAGVWKVIFKTLLWCFWSHWRCFLHFLWRLRVKNIYFQENSKLRDLWHIKIWKNEC